MKSGRVCVVGAGVAGLVAARVLGRDGFDVTIFEKEASLGGVWCESRTYPGLHTDGPREFYRYSELDYPTSADAFPSAAQVRGYLRTYAERFGVLERVRFDTEVLHAAPVRDEAGRDSGWELKTRTGEVLETARFDYLVVCNGVFSAPHMPPVQGIEGFSGEVLHSGACVDADLVRGKRVVVVGSAKSGLDCAAWAGRLGHSCTLVFREPHWMLPRYLLGLLNLKWLLYTRFTQRFLAPYYRPGRLAVGLHRFAAPLVRGFWACVSAAVRRDAAGTGELVPPWQLPEKAEGAGVGTSFYDLVRDGSVCGQRAEIKGFSGGTSLELDNGAKLEADLVVFATGFRQGVPFLEERIRALVENERGFHLYRQILPPVVPRLCFLGYGSSVANPLTTEIGAHWISQHLRGELALPSGAEMDRCIEAYRDWAAERMPGKSGFFVGLHVFDYVDELVRDMGLATVRSCNFVSENLIPLWAWRYAALTEERRRVRAGEGPPGRLYFSATHALVLLLGVAFGWALWG